MKRSIVMLSLVATLFVSARTGVAQSHIVNITGYGSGEVAVKGPVKQQVNERIFAPIAAALKSAPQGTEVRVIITGYADKTGSNAENDKIAGDRAYWIAQEVLGQYPNAQIVTRNRSTDNDANLRIVVVRWELTAPPAVRPSTVLPVTSASKDSHVLAVLGIAIIVLAAAIIALSRRNPVATIAPTEARNTTKTDEVLHFHRDGATYAVTIEWERDSDGQEWWITPFLEKDGATLNRRRDLAEAKNVATLFMTRLFNKPVVQTLIKSGKIPVTQEQEKTA